ncbi:MAG: cobyric acid synthase [Syntrophaceae bacterium]
MNILKHGGNTRYLAQMSGMPESRVLDFSANINPLGPPQWLRALISRQLERLAHYPDPDCTGIIEAFGKRWGVSPDEVIFGNGSTELLYIIPRAFGNRRAIVTAPAYADYASACRQAGMAVEKWLLKEEEGFALNLAEFEKFIGEGDLIFIGQPNNPTGLSTGTEDLRALARRNPSALFIVDEAFADFVDGIDRLVRDRPANVIVLGSLTKFYAVPGLRLGFAAADAGLAAKMRGLMPPWTVNSLAQAAGEAALLDERYGGESRAYVKGARTALAAGLGKIPGLTVYPGEANFLLVRIGGKIDAPELAARLIRKGIAVRVCSNFDGLDSRFFRVAVRTEEENERLCAALAAVLGGSAKTTPRKKTPSIMFQGTSSNAGKSILSAALCRILLQDGYSVAPFKSQNMSLNSHVTADGGEMGRAQAVQAQACRLAPDVRMNPILLKPNTDTGSQVIVMGKPVANMDVSTYIRYKPQAFAAAQQAYDSLAAEFDAVVLEGAGSPAEVNLKHHDIVNMRMAQYAGSPVLLVGDIDRGGVFASFVGTMEVLSEWERALVAGFVINRFRGDESLLQDAIDYTARHTGRPAFGTVPYIRDLGLPEEDSVTFKSRMGDYGAASEDGVEIAVIDLPHISNFTDFDALQLEPDVRVRIIRSARDLNRPDAVILPGSKNVIGDMDYLRRQGLAEPILKLAAVGHTEIVGICGGFQLLGSEVADPHGIESGGRTMAGLALLPISTVLMQEKTLRSVSARHIDSGLPLKGYEIHHGQTGGRGMAPLVVREDGEVIGLRSDERNVWGTYLHGIFDSDGFRRWFVDGLRKRKGLAAKGAIVAAYDLEPAFDRLADVVRASLRIGEIYKLMGLR